METLLKEIDSLIDNIKSDTKATKLPELWAKLIKLSLYLAQAKRQFVRLKVDKDLLEPQLKDQIRTEFETEQARKESEMTEDELKKYKRPKQTIDEIDMIMKLRAEYKANIMNRWEQEELVTYLEPLVKAYYEFVNMYKFSSKLDWEFSNYKD